MRDKKTAFEKTARETWVDVARVFIMLTIVVGHSIQVMEPKEDVRWIGLMSSPIFDYSFPCVGVLMYLFLSGWLKTNRKGWLDFKAFFFVLMPMLLWNIVCMAIDCENWVWGWGLILEAFVVNPANPPLWYLRDFAVLSLIFPMLMRIPTVVRALLVVIGLFVGELYGIRFPFRAMPFILVLSIYLMGTVVQDMFSRNQVVEFFRKHCIWITMAALLYSFIYLFGISLPTPTHASMYCVIGIVALLSYGAAVEKFLGKWTRVFSWLAPSVFTVYVSHWPLLLGIKKLYSHYGMEYLPSACWIVYGSICYLAGVLLWLLVSHLRLGMVGEWLTMQKRTKQMRG